MAFWQKPKMDGPVKVSIPVRDKVQTPNSYDSFNDVTRKALLEDIEADPSLSVLPWAQLPPDIQQRIITFRNVDRYVQVGSYSLPVVPVQDAAILNGLHPVGTLAISDNEITAAFGNPLSPGTWLFMLNDVPIALRKMESGVYRIEGYNLFAFEQMQTLFPAQAKMDW